jgi:hypothetical protein
MAVSCINKIEKKKERPMLIGSAFMNALWEKNSRKSEKSFLEKDKKKRLAISPALKLYVHD